MRILHTMLRVDDLDRSLDFYTKILNMKEIRRSRNEQYKYDLVFVGYGTEEEGPVKGGKTVIAFVRDRHGLSHQ